MRVIHKITKNIKTVKKNVVKTFHKYFGVEQENLQTNILPDSLFLKIQYRYKMHKKLSLNNPVLFNEKMQWLKLHDRNEKYHMMVDKEQVKYYVSNLIGEQYIIPTLGCWDNGRSIEFDKLPDKFVLKCTNDSGGVLVCRNKEKFDCNNARRFLDERLSRNYYKNCREWPYKGVKGKIIAEEYIESKDKMIDYKFFCFNGVAKLLYVSMGLEDHSTAKISFYNLNKEEMSFHRDDYAPFHDAPIPLCFNEMKSIAEIIAKDIGNPFVRIDLYCIDESIKFSEITFTPCAGYLPFDSNEWDKKLGDWIKLK